MRPGGADFLQREDDRLIEWHGPAFGPCHLEIGSLHPGLCDVGISLPVSPIQHA